MTAVFADTFYFFSLLDSREATHARGFARSSTSQRNGCWLNLAMRTPSLRIAPISSPFYRALVKHPRVKIIPADTHLFQRGVELFEQRSDKNWSLTDCL